MRRVVVVEQPKPVISLEEAKAQLRVDGDDDDVLITGYIAAATAHIDGPDGWLGRAIGEQVLELTLDAFPATPIALPYEPIGEVVEVRYRLPDGAWQVVDPTIYDQSGDALYTAARKSWPSVQQRDGIGSVVIRYKAGYAAVPAPIRVALLLMVDDLYRHRGNVTSTSMVELRMPTTSLMLLQPFRVYV